MRPIDAIADASAEMTTFRRDLHAHPELCFQEFRTAERVAAQLTEWGIPVHRGLGGTGVVGILRHGSSTRAIGLRADMDALPMTEHNQFAHASTHPGRMHACGHDGHTAMLLAAARYMALQRNFDGTVYQITSRSHADATGTPQTVHHGGRRYR
ncbi:metal-dependent amidase/aminoacylase/carboxypeptidase [Leptothrix ochracea L12]|uniref:Metal-dependent amidase/aminoacylase/carboxypeptidase n=1 Tax=Leptothrix ochracea L12 TaxID=735332 RepID=I4Z5X3_9BURK|nr:metal-dependent amidase/aminoacylase/carboxypeptidase [Leptothrix ochracea L12]